MGLYAETNTLRTFGSTLLEGAVGEAVLKAYIQKQGFDVVDRSDDVEYQKRDIDFEFSMNGGRVYSVEVKTDNRMYDTGNIVIEDSMQRKWGNQKGWLHYCEADILCFIDVVSYKFYFFDWPRLKSLVLSGKWSLITFNNYTDNCFGKLYKISVNELRDLGLIRAEGSLYLGN